jgi:hypothetical protein
MGLYPYQLAVCPGALSLLASPVGVFVTLTSELQKQINTAQSSQLWRRHYQAVQRIKRKTLDKIYKWPIKI